MPTIYETHELPRRFVLADKLDAMYIDNAQSGRITADFPMDLEDHFEVRWPKNKKLPTFRVIVEVIEE